MSNAPSPAGVVRGVILLLAALAAAGCSATHVVDAGPADRALLEELPRTLDPDPFWVPAEIRFQWALHSGQSLPARAESGGGDVFHLPVFPVVRESLQAAVASSFAAPYRPDAYDVALHLDARSDALEIEFNLLKVLMQHEGSGGEMSCTLNAVGVVKFPAPSTRVLARIPVEVQATGMVAEDGSGFEGRPNPLWSAAVELAREYAVRLRGPEIRDTFRNRELWIDRVHSTTGRPAPKDMPNAEFDASVREGKYVEVVRLVRR
ncbi:MAG: hypothetical protein ACF8XB_24830 [Planctomycetota bacterium JB042]